MATLSASAHAPVHVHAARRLHFATSSNGLLHWLSEECSSRGLLRLGELLDDLLTERQAEQPEAPLVRRPWRAHKEAPQTWAWGASSAPPSAVGYVKLTRKRRDRGGRLGRGDERARQSEASPLSAPMAELAVPALPAMSVSFREEDVDLSRLPEDCRDIDDSGQLRQGSKRIRLPEAALAKGRQQLQEPGDVLLSIKGGLGKVAMVQDLEHPTVPGQAFCVDRLRPNAPLTPAALVQYLRSAVGQTLLDKAGQGTAVTFVPMGEVKGLPIVIPHPDELQRAEDLEEESVALSREVEELTRRLQRLSRQGWLVDIPPALLACAEEEGA